MTIIPPEIVQQVLYVAFAVYNFLGFLLFIMGIVYQADVGSIGTAGTYCILTGLMFLVVGSVAIYATHASNWKLLFIVEMFNVALFMFCYYMIIIALLMATGTTDPVRRTTVEHWSAIKPTLTMPGSNPDDQGGITSYCEAQTTSDHCIDFYQAARIECIWTDELIMNSLNNCSLMLPSAGIGTIDNGDCQMYYSQCMECEDSCKESQITDIKEGLIPASYFCLYLTLYLVVTIVWNNVMISYENIEGTQRIAGLVLNGGLALSSFIVIVLGLAAAISADDKCPSAADGCVPSSVNWIITIGFALLGVAAMVTYGVFRDDQRLIVGGTIAMVMLAIFLVLFAMLLGISTGATMDDMTYYYDTQYPKMRNAYERVDNAYCQMSKEECFTVARQGIGTNVQSEGVDIEPVFTMDYDHMWLSMYAEAAREAALDEYNPDTLTYDSTAPDWLLGSCATTGICVYCDDLYNRVANYKLGVWDMSVDPQAIAAYTIDGFSISSGEAVAGRPCKRHTDHANNPACVERAPNFQWSRALTGTNNMENILIDQWGQHTLTGTSRVQSDLPKCMGDWAGGLFANEKCIQVVSISPADGECPDATEPCKTTVDELAGLGNYSAELAGYFSPLCDCAFPCIQYMARCATGWGDGQSGSIQCTQPSFPLQHSQDSLSGCQDISTLVPYLYENAPNSDGWSDIVQNYTYWDPKAKASMPYCEEAISDHTNDGKYCTSNSDTISAGYVHGFTLDDEYQLFKMDTYQGNCGECTAAFSPFSFTLGSDEFVQRKCLNYYVGHMTYECSPSGHITCQEEFTGGINVTDAEADEHTTYMVDKAFADGSESKFCGYSDAGCKAKIKFDLENSMTGVAIVGMIFLMIFLTIIYCNMEAIKTLGMMEEMKNGISKMVSGDQEDDDMSVSESESDDDGDGDGDED